MRNPTQKIFADSYKALSVICEKWSPFSEGGGMSLHREKGIIYCAPEHVICPDVELIKNTWCYQLHGEACLRK